jgi:hypothetical protein
VFVINVPTQEYVSRVLNLMFLLDHFAKIREHANVVLKTLHCSSAATIVENAVIAYAIAAVEREFVGSALSLRGSQLK